MEGDEGSIKGEPVDGALNEMKLSEELFSSPGVEDGAQSADHPTSKDSPSTKSKSPGDSAAPTPKSEDDIGGVTIDTTVHVEPGKAPKLSRKASSKMVQKPPPLFNDLPDATEESRSHFTTIPTCLYATRSMGASEHDTLGCDCSPEYRDGGNNACGEDSDCINRATKMECTDDECNCGAGCQNQRFQRQQYADVSVIKTEKKGFGLRADRDLQANDFIYEYIGEVIGEPVFRKRTQQYHDEGIKHFYFMSLTKNVFVDATKKGNLGRFCNHSCNPNCYVDKWVVGDKLRMGIFAERPIKAGEELVFNYNVDRYGADPQPCYCGESNCTGFIGGKTQTERATKLSHAVIEALGIEDGDGWDIAAPKKVRKKKQGEDDEEYVSKVQPKGLDEQGVTKVMATLMQCKDKWVAVKLLSRVQRCNDDKVRNRVVRMHGYQILRTTLTTWKDDDNVVLQILDILYKLPRLTRNKIVDSKIETAVTLFVESPNEDIAKESKRLLDEWSKLDLGYRIPRKKVDPNAAAADREAFERSRRESSSRQETPEKNFVAPTGPKGNLPQVRSNYYRGPPPPRYRNNHEPKNNLPEGWHATVDQRNGKLYYWSTSGQTTWQRPNTPAVTLPPPPPPIGQAKATQKNLQDIIDSIKKEGPASKTASPAPKAPEARSKEKEKKPKEDWRSWPEERQRRAYETTVSQHVIPIMSRFSKKLPKEELKKFAKEVGKTLVASDFKHGRVTDLKNIPDKTVSRIKDYTKQFFEKAVAKKVALEAKRAERKARAARDGVKESEEPEPDRGVSEDVAIMSANATPLSPFMKTPQEEGLKRKRLDGEADESTPSDSASKRFKESPTEEDDTPTPPPPPPPSHDVPMLSLEEEQAYAAQEELMRESEAALMKENDEAMEFEYEQNEHMPLLDDRRPSNDDRRPSNGDRRPSNGELFNDNRNGRHYHSNGVDRPVSRNGKNGSKNGKHRNHRKLMADRASQSPSMEDLSGVHPDRRQRISQSPNVEDLPGIHPDRRRRVSQSPNVEDLPGIHPDRKRRISQSPNVEDLDLSGIHPDRRKRLMGL